MTKRAAKRQSRESYDDGKIRRFPADRGGWSPLGANDEAREQGYLKTIKPKSDGQIGLAGAGRAERHGQVAAVDGVEERGLAV